VAIERREHCLDVQRVSVDRCPYEFVLGLEVVVDVADRDLRSLCDVRNRCLLDALLVQHLARASHEALSLAEPRRDFAALRIGA
jgi:hypothetical protein